MINDRFEKIVEKTLLHEGERSTDPYDPGGETRWGISHKAYPELVISTLTRDQAKKLYHLHYWLQPKIHLILDDAVAAKIFDLGVNLGPRRSVRILQKAMNKSYAPESELKTDGILGPLTLRVVNGTINPWYLLAVIKQIAVKKYCDIDRGGRYLKGWIRRAIS